MAGLVGLEGLVRLAGYDLVSFYTILLAFLSDLGVILVSCWCHFGVLGVSFRDLGPPRDSPRRQEEKVVEKVVLGSSPGTPSGFQINYELRTSPPEKHVGMHCAQSAAQEGSQDPSKP